MTIGRKIQKFHGFEYWSTGGGCDAYGKKKENGDYILITGIDTGSIPTTDQVQIGFYDDNEEPVLTVTGDFETLAQYLNL